MVDDDDEGNISPAAEGIVAVALRNCIFKMKIILS
jgi:hypothetical protein